LEWSSPSTEKDKITFRVLRLNLLLLSKLTLSLNFRVKLKLKEKNSWKILKRNQVIFKKSSKLVTILRCKMSKSNLGMRLNLSKKRMKRKTTWMKLNARLMSVAILKTLKFKNSILWETKVFQINSVSLKTRGSVSWKKFFIRAHKPSYRWKELVESFRILMILKQSLWLHLTRDSQIMDWSRCFTFTWVISFKDSNAKVAIIRTLLSSISVVLNHILETSNSEDTLGAYETMKSTQMTSTKDSKGCEFLSIKWF
jgi:hypothetical protein